MVHVVGFDGSSATLSTHRRCQLLSWAAGDTDLVNGLTEPGEPDPPPLKAKSLNHGADSSKEPTTSEWMFSCICFEKLPKISETAIRPQ